MAGIDRMCNLGARKGERGGARNLGALTLVPCVEGGRKEREWWWWWWGGWSGGGDWANGGGGGADSHLKLGRNKLVARRRERERAPQQKPP